nr:MAG TPA: Replication initiation and membrane attachment [Caudoviricetes sp.]
MNQLDIFRAFSIWSRYNMPTANQRSLFYGLLEVWNDTRLVRSDEWLSVPNRTLETISGLSHKTCDNVKNQLQQQGILKIKPGKRNKESAKYNITFWILSEKNDDEITLTSTSTVTPKLGTDVTLTSTPKLAPYTEKSKEENIREEKDVVNGNSSFFDELQKYLGRGLTFPESEQARAWREEQSEQMILKAVSIAVLNRTTSFAYIDKIIRNWNNQGITTLAELQAHEEKREQAKEKQSSTKAGKAIPDWATPYQEPEYSEEEIADVFKD